METDRIASNLKVGVYIRVSSHGQALDGGGPELQKTMCLNMIAQNNWTLHDIYFNPSGISGDSNPMEREEFKRND